MNDRRDDWKPAPHERAILSGRNPGERDAQSDSESPRLELSAAIRALNAKLAVLEPERVAALMPSWHASWAELERQRAAADDDAADLAVIRAWATHWKGRLGHSYAGDDQTFSYGGGKKK